MVERMSADVAARLYDLLIDDDATGSDDVEPEVAEAAPGNTLRIVSALTLQKIGDRIADPKSVLSWLLVTVGAPAGLTGLLVPIRESGSLLPQAAMLPRIRRVERRSRVWVAGAVGQALAVAAIAATAVGLRGIAAGIAVLAALAAFAVSRAMSSIAYKDVLGRTIPKGQRGQVSGLASVTSGVVTIALGLGLRLVGQDSGAAVLGGLLAAGAVMWAIAAVVFATVREPTDVESSSSDDREDVSTLATLRHDAPFRRFVTARALLLVSALSPPFVVALSNEEGEAALAQLGLFVVAQGLASMLGGRMWGRFADRSSRRTMMAAAGAASAVVVAFLVVGAGVDAAWLFPAAYFLLALAHEGARLGRKTYVTDMAEGDQRTTYVAASNTAMGVVLLGAGAISSGLALAGPRLALAFLAAAGLGGVLVGRSLPEVSGATDS